jgi:acyl carrier protein
MKSKKNRFAVTATCTLIVAGMLVVSGCNQSGSRSNNPQEITGNETSSTNLVHTKIAQIVQEQLGWKEKVTSDLRFVEDLKADSLDTVELVMAIEEEFGIEIKDEAAEKMRTVGDVVTYVQQAIDSKRP